ncbi:uncharacterized protein LOC143032627 [Oratosquilla oratoria]|uniref:uncharacterized protein LOC143032627 n=1 Tax=Oratosquilla oratoria TaxID=337810 RepID=UPI003F75F08C
MLSLALAALLSVAAGHPVAPNCFLDSALLYSGRVLPVPLVFLTNAQQIPLHNVQIVSQAAPQVSAGPVVATYSTASVATAASAGAPQSVKPTAAVAQATAEFMAAWNAAYERASKIQASLVKVAPSGYSHFTPPKQVQETEAVRRATAEFMAAWNAAAERASAVEIGVTYGPPKPVRPTPEVQRATAEFMAAWHAAAQRAAAVQATLTYSTGAPKPVDHTDEVKRATAEFMKAWKAAAARVPKIQTTMYQVSGIHAAPVLVAPQPVKFTPEVERATAEFMAAFNKAAALAAAAPDDDTSNLPIVTYTAPVPSETYTGPMASGIIMASGYTKEVEEARHEFQLAFEAAAALAAAAPDDDDDDDSVTYVEYSAPVPAPVPVVITQQVYTGPFASGDIAESGYTMEVDEARREFEEAYADAAALAAAAPDTDIVSNVIVDNAVYDVPVVSVAAPVVVPAAPVVLTAASPAPALVYTGPQASGIIVESGYTKEVDEARKEFEDAFADAAALAAAAPDTDDYSGAVVSVHYAAPVSVPAAPAPAAPAPAPAVSTVTYTGPKASGIIVDSGYTKEVHEAREEFQDAFDSAAALAAAAPDTDVYSGAVVSVQYAAPAVIAPAPAAPVETYTGPKASGIIVDSGYTKEVHEAREEFQDAFNSAAALAAAAPDVHIYTAAPAPVIHHAGAVFVTHAPAAPAPALAPAPAPVAPAAPYTGPLASGEITASGFTKEVEAARQEFLAAYREAAARIPKPDTTQYAVPAPAAPAASPAPAAPAVSAPAAPAEPEYTGPFASGVIAESGYTIEVDQARKEFMKAYEAAADLAAKTPDYNVITSSISIKASAQEGAPKPEQPAADVATATAEFMAAWNAAASRVATIESTLVKSKPATKATIVLPTREEALEALRKANEEFMAAWNAAAQRTESVKQAIQYGSPVAVKPTDEVQKATAEFMASWQAAARRVPKIEQAMVKATTCATGAPEHVEATAEVQKATAEFMAAWNAAAARVPKIETTMYAMAQPTAVSAGGDSQFVSLFKTAEQKAVQPTTTAAFIPFPVNVGFANHVGTYIAYAGTTAAVPETVATLKTFPLNQRLFAPVQGLPVFYNLAVGRVGAMVGAATTGDGSMILTWVTSVDSVDYDDKKNHNATALAALLSVAAGHPVAPNCFLDSALLYSGRILPVPQVFLTNAQQVPLHNVQMVSQAAPQVSAGPVVATYSTASVATAASAGAPQSVKPTAAVAQATAEFMAAWNAAYERASKIQASLVKVAPSGYSHFTPPKQVQETEAVRRATAEFMAAWNAAAERASAVEIGVTYGPPKPVRPTPEVQRATAEFMAAWHAAAQRAAAVQATLTYSTGAPKPVDHTDEVKRATAEFMKAWKAAAARVPKIQTTMYQVSGIHAAPVLAAPQPVKFTPEVERATAEFMAAFNKAAALAAAAPDDDTSNLPIVTYTAPVPSETYTGPMASGIIMASGYTKEVEEARREFQLAFEAAAARAAVAPDDDDDDDSVAYVEYSAPVPAPGPVVITQQVYTGPFASGDIAESGYTMEVDEARREFEEAYADAAALAAAAPDTGIVSSVIVDNAVYDVPVVSVAAPVVVPAAPVVLTAAAPAPAPAQVYTGPQASGIIVESGYTKEVDEARKEFEDAFADAAALAAAAPDTDDYSGAVVSVHYAAPVSVPAVPAPAAPAPTPAISTETYTGPKASGIIVDSGYTKEVHEAREEFQDAFDSAAALAAAAPDVHIYTAAPAPVIHHAGAVVVTHAPAAPTPALAPALAPVAPAVPYTGPLASGEITASGFTKEVEAARQEFLAAYREAAARVPKPDTTQYAAPAAPAAPAAKATPAASAPAAPAEPKYTGPFASGVIAESGYTIEVDQARKEFMEAYEAAADLAAKTPDYNVITSSISIKASALEGAPKPEQPAADVATATAEFMAAWNAAASRVATIESTLVKSKPATKATIVLPTREEALEALRKANEEFMAAWNAAAQRTESVKQAIQYVSPVAVEPTDEVQRATAEFMASWQAAARRVPKIEQAMVKATTCATGAPEHVEATAEVQKATAEFMAAWNAAAARVPKIETTMYAMAQPTAVSAGGDSQFVSLFKTAEQKAVQPTTTAAFIPFPVNVGFANHVGTYIAYAGTTAAVPETVATLKTFPLNQRLFAPVQGLPVFHNCKCDN